MANNKMTVALLGVVAVLLAVIAGVLVFGSSGSGVPGVDTSTLPANTNTNAQSPTTQPPSNVTTGPFDPAKATKVPAGETPQTYVEAYFKAVKDGNFAAAYKMLPVDKQASYGSAESFGNQLKSYAASGYKMGQTQGSGDEMVVNGALTTSAGDFGYTWTFVKYKGNWVVKSRALSGMGQ